MEKKNLDCRLYSIIYYLNINGGLTAADLLSEVAADSSFEKIENSELFKAEFVQLITKNAESETKIDDYVIEKLVTGLKECHEKNKLDIDYYDELGDVLGVKPTPEPEAEEEKVEVTEEEVKSEESAEKTE